MKRNVTGIIIGIVCGMCVLFLVGFSILSNWGIITMKKECRIKTNGLGRIFVNSDYSTLNIYPDDFATDIQVIIEGRKRDVYNTSVQSFNNTLRISGTNGQSHNVCITIVVPKNSSYCYEADVLSGSVALRGLQGNDFIICCNNGEVVLSDVQTENLEITADNGAVTIDSLRGRSHSVKSHSGTVVVTNSSGETLLIESDNGTIQGENLEYKTITPISENGTVDM